MSAMTSMSPQGDGRIKKIVRSLIKFNYPLKIVGGDCKMPEELSGSTEIEQ